MGARRPSRIRAGMAGRPTKLLAPGVFDTIVEYVRVGTPVSLACQKAGVAETSYRNWLMRGRVEHERRGGQPDPETGEPADDTTPDEDEQPFVEFYLAVLEARASAAIRNTSVIQKVAQGGTVIEETTRTYTDSEGNLVEEKTVRRQPPDWRAAAWYLERSHRGEYGKDAVTVELTGPPPGCGRRRGTRGDAAGEAGRDARRSPCRESSRPASSQPGRRHRRRNRRRRRVRRRDSRVLADPPAADTLPTAGHRGRGTVQQTMTPPPHVVLVVIRRVTLFLAWAFTVVLIRAVIMLVFVHVAQGEQVTVLVIAFAAAAGFWLLWWLLRAPRPPSARQ